MSFKNFSSEIFFQKTFGKEGSSRIRYLVVGLELVNFKYKYSFTETCLSNLDFFKMHSQLNVNKNFTYFSKINNRNLNLENIL